MFHNDCVLLTAWTRSTGTERLIDFCHALLCHPLLDSDCILHGYIKKLGGPFASAWQTRYAKLYPNRLELHYESSNSKPELVLMDHIEEVSSDLTTCKGEQSILLRTREGGRVVLTNQVGFSFLWFSWFHSIFFLGLPSGTP